jgi:hypothetical protein
MTTKTLTLLTLFLLGGLFASGQDRTSPKKIKTKGDYIHNSTSFVFPEKFETYSRQAIYSFNKANSNIGVVYENQNIGKTTISIYVYPAGNEGSEGRLRNEYLKSMQEIANNSSGNGFWSTQFPVRHDGEYICNGFKAISDITQTKHNTLTLYECGTWFLKIRLTTDELDSTQIAQIENKILEKYKPSDLTKLKPLTTKGNIYFAKAAFADSLMLGSIMGSAFKKMEWANNNLKENEKASGFPDIYLEMQIESLKELLLFKNKHNYKKGEASKKYLEEVALLVNSGFLPEFIMKQFDMILIVPDKQIFNFDGYEKWRQTNNLTLDLNKRYYVISYGQK